MDHSLRSYLERRSVGELRAILNYLVANHNNAPEEVVETVIAVLEERRKDNQPEIAQELQMLWERYLNRYKTQKK